MVKSSTVRKLKSHILQQMRTGQYVVGSHLPSIRELSELFSFSTVAVNGILKELAKEGFLISEKRKGYKVVRLPLPMETISPVAYVMGEDPSFDQDEVHSCIKVAFEKSASERQIPLLGIKAPFENPDLCIRQIKAANCSGIILDSYFSNLADKVAELNIPIVQVNSMVPNQINCVIQDNFDGGMKAAEYLIKEGHEKIGWIGNNFGSCHSFERFGGAISKLASVGLSIDSKHILNYDNEETFANSHKEIEQFLRSKNRPTALLCLWKEFALPTLKIMRRVELEPGKDLTLVGWSINESYEKDYGEYIENNIPLPVVSWKAKTMADIALDHLGTIRTSLNPHIIRSSVPVELIGVYP